MGSISSAGTGWVTVTISGLGDINETYSITESADMTAEEKNAIGTGTPTGATMDDLGIDGATNDTLKITVEKDSAIAGGDSVKFSAALTAAAADNYSYDVVVKTTAGDVKLPGVKGTTAVDDYLEITSDVTITDIVVSETPKFAIDEENTKVIDSKTVQIAFNLAVADEAGEALDRGDFAAGTGVAVVNVTVIDEKTIQVQLNTTMDDNDTIVLDAAKFASKDDSGNKFSADQTITIDLTDGVYSIDSIA